MTGHLGAVAAVVGDDCHDAAAPVLLVGDKADATWRVSANCGWVIGIAACPRLGRRRVASQHDVVQKLGRILRIDHGCLSTVQSRDPGLAYATLACLPRTPVLMLAGNMPPCT
jgi:hypothetical protein